MNAILTLVASEGTKPLTETILQTIADQLPVKTLDNRWLAPEKAADLQLSEKPPPGALGRLESLLAESRIDFFIAADDGKRRKKLLVADMDNTMVVGETLDELAAQCGLKDKIAAITDRAMRGELDFRAALQQRVAMLRDLPEEALQATLKTIQPMAGAVQLVRTMSENGAKCVLASGGFSCFTDPVARRIGFHESHGNSLCVRDGRLTGEVAEPIVDHQSKLSFLRHYQELYRLEPGETMAVGDGANDLAMISAAGLGVGFHPKPYLKERVENNVLHGDLTALLYAQGYSDFSQ